jgi:hypothetical protein
MTGCDNIDCDEPADVPCLECGNTYCFAHAGHPEPLGRTSTRTRVTAEVGRGTRGRGSDVRSCRPRAGRRRI